MKEELWRGNPEWRSIKTRKGAEPAAFYHRIEIYRDTQPFHQKNKEFLALTALSGISQRKRLEAQSTMQAGSPGTLSGGIAYGNNLPWHPGNLYVMMSEPSSHSHLKTENH
jgi:hypothetical protein